MRIAVISDIHGNAVAFDAVLETLRRDAPDHVVCLGDAVQGGPDPHGVIDRLRALGCPVVMGNADAFLLGIPTREEGASRERRHMLDTVRDWSLAQLSGEALAFMRAFAPVVRQPLDDGATLLGFHGSPGSFDDLLFPTTPDEAFDVLLGGVDARVTCGGHTHQQFVRRRGAGWFFNPGSVGLVYDPRRPGDRALDPWAEYAVLTSRGGDLSLEFRRVAFDVAALVARYRASGRPFSEQAIQSYGG